MQDRYGAAADKMLNALVFRDDHLELSGQFDKDSGYGEPDLELCVVELLYASFLAAVRAKDRPERAGLAAGRAGEGRTPVGQRHSNLASRPAGMGT